MSSPNDRFAPAGSYRRRPLSHRFGESPVRYLYLPGGLVPGRSDRMRAWAVIKYQDIRGVLRDLAIFSFPLATRLIPRLVWRRDDPLHRIRCREFVRKASALGNISGLEADIGPLASDWSSGGASDGSKDSLVSKVFFQRIFD